MLNYSTFYQEALKIALSITTALVTIKISKNSIFLPRKLDILKSQLYNVYLPLFKMLEKDIHSIISNKKALDYSVRILEIIEDNYEIVPFDLVLSVRNLNSVASKKSAESQNEYQEVCYLVDYYFEKARKLLNMPTRTLRLKKKANQVPRKLIYLVDSIEHYIGNFLLLLSLSIFIYFLFQYLSKSFINT